MIYRGPGFLTVVLFDSSAIPAHPLSPVSKLSLFHSLSACRFSSLLLSGEGGGGVEGGAKLSNPEKESLALFK